MAARWPEIVAWMQRSGIQDSPRSPKEDPDSAALHPGYTVGGGLPGARKSRIRSLPERPVAYVYGPVGRNDAPLIAGVSAALFARRSGARRGR